MKIAILQSNYIPWKGFFDLLDSVDVFVIYDCVQYTKNDWRNRNRVLVNGSPLWLTIPVTHASATQRIDETKVADGKWARKHWLTVSQAYARTPGMEKYGSELEALYSRAAQKQRLSEINRLFIEYVCQQLHIYTQIESTDGESLIGDRTERLISLCERYDCNEYVSGPAAKSYLSDNAFDGTGIQLSWFDYGEYPTYTQRSDDFHHDVSIIDLLMNCGPNAQDFYKSE